MVRVVFVVQPLNYSGISRKQDSSLPLQTEVTLGYDTFLYFFKMKGQKAVKAHCCSNQLNYSGFTRKQDSNLRPTE